MVDVRILHVGPDMGAHGGIASVLAGLNAHAWLFAKRGYTVDFLATTSATSEHAWLKPLFFVRAVARLAGRLIRHEVDIVHLHTSVRGSSLRKGICALVCTLMRKPYVLHVHSGAFIERYLDQSVPGRFCQRKMLRDAAAVIVLSKHTRDTMVTHKLTSSETCHLVYNGVADPLHGKIRHDGCERPVTITFLGSISAAKGVPVLVSAIARMRKQMPAFRVILGGLGDVSGLLDAIACEKVASLVSYVGWLGEEKKSIILADTDIFVLPSRSEGFPVAIIEAMAHGIAIVSTAIPGVMDAIRHELDGLLILPDDEAALVESLERLVTDASERRRLGVSARQRFLDGFTIDMMVSQLVDIYAAVTLGHSTPATGKPCNKQNR